MTEQHQFGEPDLAGPQTDHGPGAPLLGALAGAAVGAGLWAAITGLTGYEVGYVAWGVGGIVGFGASKLGGRGSGLGLVCAALALAAIFVGKMGAVQLAISTEIDEVVTAQCSPEAYETLIAEAQELPIDGSDHDVRGFMIDNDYTHASHADEISDEEFAGFREETMPEIESWIDAPPSYEEWEREQRELYEEFAGELSLTEVVTEDLGAMDILFAGLGVMTAYRMVAGSQQPIPRRARSHPSPSARRREEGREDERPEA